MSSSVANAQHLQKMDLLLGKSDINFLQSILPCLASSQSLQELVVWCYASGVFSGCATHTCICTFLHAHKCHTLEHTTPITCLQSECVHAVLTNGHQSHMLRTVFLPCHAQHMKTRYTIFSYYHINTSSVTHTCTYTHAHARAHTHTHT